MRPLDWIDAGGMLLAFLLGFTAWRVLEIVQLAGARMRHRRAIGELTQATREATREARRLRWWTCVDRHQRSRAKIARELAGAAGIGSDRDWLGRKSPDAVVCLACVLTGQAGKCPHTFGGKTYDELQDERREHPLDVKVTDSPDRDVHGNFLRRYGRYGDDELGDQTDALPPQRASDEGRV